MNIATDAQIADDCKEYLRLNGYAVPDTATAEAITQNANRVLKALQHGEAQPSNAELKWS